MEYKIVELTKEIMAKDFQGFCETLNNLRLVGEITLEKAKTTLDKINLQDSHIFVAIDDNFKILATTTIMIEQKFIRNNALAGHIEDVSTRKGFEKQGLATIVINSAINYAKSRGCYKIILDCENELKLFYSKFGFKEEGLFMALRF